MSAFDANLSFGMIFVAAGFGVSPPGNVAHGVQPTHAQMATAVPTTAAIAPTMVARAATTPRFRRRDRCPPGAARAGPGRDGQRVEHDRVRLPEPGPARGPEPSHGRPRARAAQERAGPADRPGQRRQLAGPTGTPCGSRTGTPPASAGGGPELAASTRHIPYSSCSAALRTLAEQVLAERGRGDADLDDVAELTGAARHPPREGPSGTSGTGGLAGPAQGVCQRP